MDFWVMLGHCVQNCMDICIFEQVHKIDEIQGKAWSRVQSMVSNSSTKVIQINVADIASAGFQMQFSPLLENQGSEKNLECKISLVQL